MKPNKTLEITKPSNQLKLFGYEKYFSLFDDLYQKNKLPNSILLSGSKGLGKATFAYHFINYLLSREEDYNYNKNDFLINEKNSTYKSINNNTHANFFLLDSINGEKIKIDQIRNLLTFLNKTTYNKGLKIVLIDNVELLNINSSNALLKAIEEPCEKTYFFIINSAKKILSTIRSRCIEFSFNFSFSKKKFFFNNLVKDYDLIFNETDLDNFLYFDSHGNLLRYLFLLKETNISISENYQSCISHLLNAYKNEADYKILNYASLFIQNFYNQLSLKNSERISNYYNNLNKILYSIDNLKKYNLDKKNLIFSINKIIKNEG